MKDLILTHLPASFPWRGNIHFFDTIDSTNTRIRELAAAGAPHGTVVIAGSQTGGRGRLGRSFHSPVGGIYMSVLLRFDLPPQQLMHLTCAAAVAMCDAVEETAGIRPGIKWTNDLVVSGKKLGGILTELSLAGNRVDYAVIGIGINCCQTPTDFPADLQNIATSLHLCVEKAPDRAVLAAAMISALAQMNCNLADVDAILEEYRKNCITIGKEISLLRGTEVRHGKAVAVDKDGSLIVEFPNGSTESVSSGEVSIRGMYGYI